MQNICLMSIVTPSRRSSDEQRPHVTCTTCPCSPGVFHETPELRLAHNFMLSEGVSIYSKHYLTAYAHIMASYQDPVGSLVRREGGHAPSKFSSKGGPGRFRTPPLYLPPYAVATRDRHSSKSDPANLPWLLIVERRYSPVTLPKLPCIRCILRIQRVLEGLFCPYSQ